MRKSLKLSAIALLTTALTALPAHAVSLNLGGSEPIVDLGGGNNADATVSVDTGNLLGGDDGGETNANSTVDVNLGDGSDGGSDSGIVNDGGSGGVVNLGGDGGLVNLGDNDNSSDGDLVDIELGSTGGRQLRRR